MADLFAFTDQAQLSITHELAQEPGHLIWSDLTQFDHIASHGLSRFVNVAQH